MNWLIAYLLSVGFGACFGLFSARMLLRQTTQKNIPHGFFWVGHALLRLCIFGLISWYLLQWGSLPLILFGGSLLMVLWIVILTTTN